MAAEKTIKTVKNIDRKVWEDAVDLAGKRGEPFGKWLDRAILRQCAAEQRKHF